MVMPSKTTVRFSWRMLALLSLAGTAGAVDFKGIEIGKPIYAHLMHVRDNNEEVHHCRKLMADSLIAKNIPWTDGSFIRAATVLNRLAGYFNYLK